MTFGIGLPTFRPPCPPDLLQPEDVCGLELARKMVIGATWTGWAEPGPESLDLTGYTITAEFYVAAGDPLATLTIGDGLTIGTPARRVEFEISAELTAQARVQPARMPCPTRLIFVLSRAGGERTFFGLQLFFPIDRKTTGDLPESDYDYIWLPQ